MRLYKIAKSLKNPKSLMKSIYGFLLEMEDIEYFMDTEQTEKGNILRFYADTPEKTVIFESENMDIRELKKKVELLGIEYKYGEHPVRIEKREEL